MNTGSEHGDSVPDECFANIRLAEVYDDLEADRDDLGHYVAMVDEFEARHVLDVGCGTGVLACRLAAKVSRSPVSTRQRHRWPLPGASLVQIECDGSLATPPRCLRWKPTWPR